MAGIGGTGAAGDGKEGGGGGSFCMSAWYHHSVGPCHVASFPAVPSPLPPSPPPRPLHPPHLLPTRPAHPHRGGKGTCFAYGQTGSGKTYTMQPLPLRSAADIFGILALPQYAELQLWCRCGVASAGGVGVGGWGLGWGASMQLWEHVCWEYWYWSINTHTHTHTHTHTTLHSCYEIYGNKLFDLLNGRFKLEVREDAKKRVQVRA